MTTTDNFSRAVAALAQRIGRGNDGLAGVASYCLKKLHGKSPSGRGAVDIINTWANTPQSEPLEEELRQTFLATRDHASELTRPVPTAAGGAEVAEAVRAAAAEQSVAAARKELTLGPKPVPLARKELTFGTTPVSTGKELALRGPSREAGEEEETKEEPGPRIPRVLEETAKTEPVLRQVLDIVREYHRQQQQPPPSKTLQSMERALHAFPGPERKQEQKRVSRLAELERAVDESGKPFASELRDQIREQWALMEKKETHHGRLSEREEQRSDRIEDIVLSHLRRAESVEDPRTLLLIATHNRFVWNSPTIQNVIRDYLVPAESTSTVEEEEEEETEEEDKAIEKARKLFNEDIRPQLWKAGLEEGLLTKEEYSEEARRKGWSLPVEKKLSERAASAGNPPASRNTNDVQRRIVEEAVRQFEAENKYSLRHSSIEIGGNLAKVRFKIYNRATAPDVKSLTKRVAVNSKLDTIAARVANEMGTSWSSEDFFILSLPDKNE
jgi:hypothetical protein